MDTPTARIVEPVAPTWEDELRFMILHDPYVHAVLAVHRIEAGKLKEFGGTEVLPEEVYRDLVRALFREKVRLHRELLGLLIKVYPNKSTPYPGRTF